MTSLDEIPKRRPWILGIDPGLDGGVAFIDRDFLTVQAYRMPTLTLENGKRRIDSGKLALLIDSMNVSHAVVEEVGVMTGVEGRVSMFNFGKGAGIIEGILSSNMIPIYPVKPAVWKSSLGLSRDKDASRRKATALYSKYQDLWKRKGDDGVAEAVLLAHIGLSL